jgi:hypothetical protein
MLKIRVALNNKFDVLEEVVDDKTTSNVVRKAKKKLREIETLKKKGSTQPLSEEETEKIKLEKFWTTFVKAKPKPIPANKYRIVHSVCKNKKKVEGEYECPICFDAVPKEDIVATNCNHHFCKTCVNTVIKHSNKNTLHCSLCRTQITNYDFQTDEIVDETMNLLHSKGRYVKKNPNTTTYYNTVSSYNDSFRYQIQFA